MSDKTRARGARHEAEATTEKTACCEPNADATATDADHVHVDDGAAVEDEGGMEQQLQQAIADKERVNALYTRLLADYDNYRRRTTEEQVTIRQTAAADLGQRLLPVIDNLERAISSADDPDNAFVDGVRLVLRQLLQALKASGIEPIVSEGQPFDPTYHEAVDSVSAQTDDERGTVVAEMQKGYMLGDRVLRPALVRVAN